MIRRKGISFSAVILIAVSVWLISYSLLMPQRTIETVRTALQVFVQSILPLLAVFSVCTKILVKTDAFGRLIGVRAALLFQSLGMSVRGFSVFLISLFAGFPTGAMLLSELCEKGEISVREAESLLPFCNQASVAFLFGTVGSHILKDPRMGFVFFFAQTTAALVCVCLTARERHGCEHGAKTRNHTDISVVSAFTVSVRETAFSMIGVCGFVVFFSLVGTVFNDTLSALGLSSGKLFCAMIGGGLEISSGFILLSEGTFSMTVLLICGGALVGFGGISVFMQAIERTEPFFFAPMKYFEGKVMESVLCSIFSVLFFFLYERKSGKYFIVMTSILIFCIFYLLNYVKLKFFSKKCGKIERNAV